MMFCHDSFKLPLCLFYHYKVIATACILAAINFRRSHKCDNGVDMMINGHMWYKWIDSAIDSSEVIEVLNLLGTLYAK